MKYRDELNRYHIII